MKLLPPDLVNLHGQETGREALSHTRIGVLLACQQKFNWQYEHRLEPTVKKASLAMGAAFATALEEGDPQAGFNQIMDEYAALASEAAGNPWMVAPPEKEAEVEAFIVLAASRSYLAHYGASDVQREITMRSRVRNPATGAWSRTFDVQARIDGLAGDRLIEDKFVGRVDQVTDRKLKLDRQVTLGCYLHWRTTGEIIREVAYRMTKKPSIRQKQGETHGAFCDRVIADYEARPEFYLHEFPLERTEDDFLRLEQELWSWAEQIRAARRDAVYPRNTSACSDFGGCQFLPLCSREPGAIHQFAERQPYEFVMKDEPKEIAA